MDGTSGPRARVALAIASTMLALQLAIMGGYRLFLGHNLYEDFVYGVTRWAVLAVGAYGIVAGWATRRRALTAWMVGAIIAFNPFVRPSGELFVTPADMSFLSDTVAKEWACLDIVAGIVFAWLAITQFHGASVAGRRLHQSDGC